MFDRKINKFIVVSSFFNINKTLCTNIPENFLEKVTKGLLKEVPKEAELTKITENRNLCCFANYMKADVPIDNLKETSIGDPVKSYKDFKLIKEEKKVYYEINTIIKGVKKYKTINYTIYIVEKVENNAPTGTATAGTAKKEPATTGTAKGINSKINDLEKRMKFPEVSGNKTGDSAKSGSKTESMGNKLTVKYNEKDYSVNFKFYDENNTEQNLIVNINDNITKNICNSFKNDKDLEKIFKSINIFNIKNSIGDFKSKYNGNPNRIGIEIKGNDIFIKFKVISKNNVGGSQNFPKPPVQSTGNNVPPPPPLKIHDVPIINTPREQPTPNTPTDPNNGQPTGNNQQGDNQKVPEQPTQGDNKPEQDQQDNNPQAPEQDQQDVQNDDKKKKKYGCYNKNKGKK